MKKIIAMILAAAMICSLAACGTKSTGSETSEQESSSTAESAPEPTPESTPEVTPESAEMVDAGEDTVTVRGGSNQEDAELLPLETKLYGTVKDKNYYWFAFTTGDGSDLNYQITTVNKTVGSEYLDITVYDEYGEKLSGGKAYNSGKASTFSVEGLSPNTTYYIALCINYGSGTIDFMISIHDPNRQDAGIMTSDDISQAKGAAVLEETVSPGSNQDDAALIPTDAKISGTAKDDNYYWLAFTTGNGSDLNYQITAVNKTVGSEYLDITVYDEYGEKLSGGKAYNSGKASTFSVEGLSPNTTYYIALCINYGSGVVDYSLTVRAPETAEPAPATVEKEEEPLVFETPFELNSTQVMFVANKAVFIDENAAKAALEPVAEVILAHPDHSILIAGTTATDGTQESCVTLSNKRAEAVKDLLVSAFGVPESQIQTIGLGYEADPFVRGKDRDANGNFVETEGAKNRRVVVLDIDDPIAQELLNK